MTSATVFIVDDDAGIRSSLALLLETADITSAGFASAADFLAACGPSPEGCLISDVRMPGMSGLQLQDEMALRQIHLPIIFLTGFADVPMAVGAMRKGAIEFMAKPINGAVLLEHVHRALEINRLQRNARAARARFDALLSKLTPREREVLVLALSGMANKTISDDLGISVRTTEGYRTRIYLKLGVDSLIEVAQLATLAGMPLSEIASLS